MARQQLPVAGRAGWRLTLDLPSYVPAMCNLVDRELRRQLYEAYTTRASDCGPQAGSHDNSAVTYHPPTRRQQLARLLGFDNYAALSLATKMAPSPTAVVEFLEDLGRQARPAATAGSRAAARLRAHRTRHGPARSLGHRLLLQQLRRHRYQLNQEAAPLLSVAESARRPVRDHRAPVQSALRARRGRGNLAPWMWNSTRMRCRRRHALAISISTSTRAPANAACAWMDDCLSRWQHGDDTQLPVA